MKNPFLLSLLLFTVLISSCTHRIYKSPEFEEITKNHRRIAILPPQTSITLDPERRTKISKTELRELELNQAKSIQEAIESFLVNKKLTVRVQSANITNDILLSNYVNLQGLNDISVIKLSEMLGVDAVITGTMTLEQPMTDALARGLDVAKVLELEITGRDLIGGQINTVTNKGQGQLNVFEGQNGDRIWSFTDELNLKAGSETNDVVNAMMRKCAFNFPYRVKK